ncbi:MAG: thermonuclease family protein [Pseudomonadota bacterium]
MTTIATQPINALSAVGKHLVSIFSSVLIALGPIMSAAVAGFLIVALWFYVVPTKAPGDRIAAGAKEVFVGRVTAVSSGELNSIHLWLETDKGSREVELAEIGLVPDMGPKLSAWRAESLDIIRSELTGKEVAVFAARPMNPYGPSLAHVGRYPNDWLNGNLVERGLCYTVRLDRSQRVAFDDLAELERAARDRRRGCWDFVNRALFMNFYRHL